MALFNMGDWWEEFDYCFGIFKMIMVSPGLYFMGPVNILSISSFSCYVWITGCCYECGSC